MALEPIDAIPSFAFWIDGCQAFAKNVFAALVMADEDVSLNNVIRFVRSMPRMASELQTDAWQSGYCSKCLEKACNRVPEEERQLIPSTIWGYFLMYFPDRSYTAQTMLIDALLGFAMGIGEAALLEEEKEVAHSTPNP